MARICDAGTSGAKPCTPGAFRGLPAEAWADLRRARAAVAAVLRLPRPAPAAPPPEYHRADPGSLAPTRPALGVLTIGSG
eukprot:4475219-Lingulodinium_polyedra.AAC.1